jgi:hypothetical protein
MLWPRDTGRASKSAGFPIVAGDEMQASVHHIGQAYFDGSLRAEIERQFPYNLSMQKLVPNNNDGFALIRASTQYDPFVKYFCINSKDVTGKFLKIDCLILRLMCNRWRVYTWTFIGIDFRASKSQ